MELFATKKNPSDVFEQLKVAKLQESTSIQIQHQDSDIGNDLKSFAELGLADWICNSVSSMGFRHPTSIQAACVPSILK